MGNWGRNRTGRQDGMVKGLLCDERVVMADMGERNAAQVCQSNDYQNGRDEFEFSEIQDH